MQKPIARIIITKFFCWMPIGIMAFVTGSGLYNGIAVRYDFDASVVLYIKCIKSIFVLG